MSTEASHIYKNRQEAYEHLVNSTGYEPERANAILDKAYEMNDLPPGASVYEGALERASDIIGNSWKETPEVFEEDYSLSIEDQMESARKQFDLNMENFPKISDAALGNAISTAGSLDQFMSDRFYKNLENVLPTWKEDIIGGSKSLLESVSAITDSQLKGEIPQDVQDYIIRTRAELGISRGLFGEVATYATARDLGKTSMDIQQQGISNAVNAVSPLTQRLLDFSKQLTPPVSDPSQLYGAGMGALAGVNLTSVGSVMGMGLQADQFNQNMAYAQGLGALNYDMQQQAMAIQQKQYEDAQDAAFWNTIIGAGTTLAGFALAPATGGLSMALPAISSAANAWMAPGSTTPDTKFYDAGTRDYSGYA